MPTHERSEQEIFTELAKLCGSPGYVHAIAYLCFRENIILHRGNVTTDDTAHLFSMERLIRAEISTLIGLLVRQPISYDIPSATTLQSYISETKSLLHDLHKAMSAEVFIGLSPEAIAAGDFDPFGKGTALREPIFYGGESAYSFQYREFSRQKYAADSAWLQSHKGFVADKAVNVITAIGRFQFQKLQFLLSQFRTLPVEEWTFLPGLTFSTKEIHEFSGIDAITIQAVINAFVLPCGEINTKFTALNEFNATNATPLLPSPNGYILFQHYSLVESMYESPFYWMASDKGYVAKALENRGQFTEQFSREMLERVFGTARVHANVNIVRKNGDRVSEIDVLVLFDDHTIVLQAKSKRLTIEARKGNDFQIQDDFKKAVQDAYDQAYACSIALADPDLELIGATGAIIECPVALEKIYPVCIVADHYPALAFQARKFLKYQTDKRIEPPLVTDVFTLDAMTEMLRSPLRFLHYLHLRAKFGEKITVMHELTLLGFHLKSNLWVQEDCDLMMLMDDIAADLDLAMMVRREGVPGVDTPSGILTKLRGTPVGKIIDQIETAPDDRVVDLGMLLLSLGDEAIDDINKGIKLLGKKARQDGKSHDLTVGFGWLSSGLTVYCNGAFDPGLRERLRKHCILRKYSQKAKTWFGVVIRPDDLQLVLSLHLDYDWVADSEMDWLSETKLKKASNSTLTEAFKRQSSVGRNSPCPCGSGKKHKKCCLLNSGTR